MTHGIDASHEIRRVRNAAQLLSDFLVEEFSFALITDERSYPSNLDPS